MRILLELIRVIVIFVLFGVISSYLLNKFYLSLNLSLSNIGNICVSVSLLILLFILYRNKWQFSGFYQGAQSRKLSRIVNRLLICSIIVLFIVAPFI